MNVSALIRVVLQILFNLHNLQASGTAKMSWAADEWKDGLPPQALQKISQLETQLDKFKKDRDQKQCQLESLEIVSFLFVLFSDSDTVITDLDNWNDLPDGTVAEMQIAAECQPC